MRRSELRETTTYTGSPQSDLTWSSTADDNGNTRVQLTTFMLDDDIESARCQEYDKILGGMRVVAQLTKEMNLMASQQGGLLDRIDYNLEHSSIQTRATVEVIRQRSDMESLDKRRLVVLFLVVMIIILATAVILKPKNQ
jgi:t-SNARE complex subunit (syntaxin)